MSNKSTSPVIRRTRLIVILLLPFLLTALSCEIAFTQEQKSIQATQTALSEQQNQQSNQEATDHAEETSSAMQATITAERMALDSTLQAQQATLTAQAPGAGGQQTPQVTQQLIAPQSTSTPTPTQTSTTSTAIMLTEWDAVSFIKAPEGCMNSGILCWKSNDRAAVGFNDVTLTMKEELLIEEGWQSPYLVFWHQYYFDMSGRIYIKPEGEPWAILKIYNKGTLSEWTQEYFDLRPYKGKNVRIQFLLEPYRKVSTWFIEEIQIIPDFTPP